MIGLPAQPADCCDGVVRQRAAAPYYRHFLQTSSGSCNLALWHQSCLQLPLAARADM